jgi:multisubunit Na+/H+ antiporter MnhE subunit
MKTAVLHLTIAFIWLFFGQDRDLPRLLIGLALGWGVLVLFRPLLPEDGYLRRSLAFFRWLWAFTRAFVASQIRVAQNILLPSRYPVSPGFLYFPIEDLSDLEILVLSHTISLTPGTTSVEVERESGRLLIHALEADHPEEVISSIQNQLLEPLLAFSRP